jgi:hypothetical protein
MAHHEGGLSLRRTSQQVDGQQLYQVLATGRNPAGADFSGVPMWVLSQELASTKRKPRHWPGFPDKV